MTWWFWRNPLNVPRPLELYGMTSPCKWPIREGLFLALNSLGEMILWYHFDILDTELLH